MEKITIESSPRWIAKVTLEALVKTGDGCNGMGFPNDESKEWVCLGSYAPILLGNWEMMRYQPWNGTVISLAKLGALTVCWIL